MWLKAKEKAKRLNKNLFTCLQACFLGDVRVIGCNSLGDSHFQTNVIENVEHLITFCLHITYFVFCTLTSCTHYMQINVEFCTCDCVCYLIWPSLITYELIWKYNFLDQGGIWRKILLEVLNQVIFTSCVSFNCENIFEIFWECSCASHIIKTTFQLFFDKISKVFQNFKIFTSSINRSWSLTNQNCLVFRPKLYGWFNSCSNDAQ